MKKFLLACLIGTSTLIAFNSCTKEYITNNNYLPGVSYVVSVNSNQWTKTDGVYQANISMPELDDVYFEDGHVNVAISFNSNSSFYENIPADLNSFYGSGSYTMHHYGAKYRVGEVIVTAEAIGGADRAPESMLIKIVLTDAEIGN